MEKPFVMMHPEYRGTTMTYAGRLDPMAEGVLVVLCGEKNKERGQYTSLDKEYEFEFMLGVETDTYDVLGKVTAAKGEASKDAAMPDEAAVRSALEKYTGKFIQKYPPYSSKPVDGVPLYQLAREGKITEDKLPTHEVEVKKMELLGSRTVSKEDLKKLIIDAVRFVDGDFRQDEILTAWEAYFASAPQGFIVWKAHISCGSGFYVRQLVADVGRNLGAGGVTVSILRTRVGSYLLADSQK